MKPPLLIALLAAALAACGKSVSEREPNDDISHAAAMPAGGRAQGTISKPDDADWYKLAIDRDSGVLSFHVGGIKEVDFVLSFRDKEGRELKRIDETGVGGDEWAPDLGVLRGDYYMVVSNKNPKADNPGQKYTLSSRLDSAAGREREPDDTALSAGPLELNGVTRGHYFPTVNLLSEDPEQVEEDWFSIAVDRAGLFALNFDLNGVPGVQPVMELYDVNSYKLKEVSAEAVGVGLSLKDFGVRAPARYFLRLRSRGKRMGNFEAFYELLSELRPYDGRTELEPNDQRDDATPFDQETLTGHVAPAGDADWYRVNAATDSKQLLHADLSAVPGLDVALTVADELGQPLLTVDGGGKEAPEVLTGFGAANATYYLVVTEKTGKAANSRDVYKLVKSLVPWQAGLEWEPNDSTAAAQGLKVGDSVDGYLAPKADVDYYEFNVYQKSAIAVDLTGLLNVRWSVELYDQESRQLHAQVPAKMGAAVSFEKPLEPGTYLLILRAVGPGQNNVRDKYTLRLRAK